MYFRDHGGFIVKRLLYLDWLRVLATIAVVMIHVTAGAGHLNKMDSGHYENWIVANLFETLSRWSVPVFVMISGALLLKDQKSISYIEFLRKRAGKVVIPFVGWSILFYVYGAYTGYYPASVKHAIKLFITNGISYHLWFLYMIVGMYLVTPLLQVFVKNANRKQIHYFLFLWLYASVITRLCDYYLHAHLSIELFFATDYVGYFILGYYLSNYEITKKWRNLSYLGGILGFLLTFFGTFYYTLRGNGQLDQFWYSYFSPNVLLCSVGLFIWFRYFLQEKNGQLPFVCKAINQVSLGVYILHFWLMNNFLWRLYPQIENYFHNLMVITLPINIGITLILSILITYILKKLPYVKVLVP